MNFTDEQFDAFLATLPKVRTAQTEQEREAIYAFRHLVFIEQLGSKVTKPDRVRRRMHDAEDDEPDTKLLYTADEKGITGTTRIRHWQPGEVPPKDFDKFSMQRFKGVEQLRIGEMARLMLRADQRDGLTLVALSYAILDVGRPSRHLDLVFANCHTGLVRYYGLIGWRRYAGRMIPSPNGLTVPLVMVVSDVEYLRSINSYLAPLGERTRLEPLDVTPLAELFDEHNLPVQFDEELVRAAINSGMAANAGFLKDVSTEAAEALVEKGFILQVPAGELLTEAGLGQRELFIVIDGEFESFNDEHSLRRMYPGEVVGEVAFFSSDGRRTASVRSIQAGRVLVLRRHALDELRVAAPAVAAEIYFHLARTLADRTGRAHLAPGR